MPLEVNVDLPEVPRFVFAYVKPLAKVVCGPPRPIAGGKQPVIITSPQLAKRMLTHFRESLYIKGKIMISDAFPAHIPKLHRRPPACLHLWTCLSEWADFKCVNLVIRLCCGKMKQESANGICGRAWKPIEIVYG